QAQEEIGEGSANPTIIQPSSSQPQQKQQPRRSKKKDTQVPKPSGLITNVVAETLEYTSAQTRFERVSKTSNDPLEHKDYSSLGDYGVEAESQEAREEGKVNTHKLKRLYKIGSKARVASDEESLVDENAEDQGRIDDEVMFDVSDLVGEEVMINDDYQLGEQLQAQEQEELTIKEKSKLFVQLLKARKKHFAALRAEERRNKPPTKAQKRNTMCTYLKNMAGYKDTQLKNKSFDDIQKLFDKEMKKVNTFVDIDTEVVEESSKKAEIAQEESSKRVGTEIEKKESAKKQKIDDAQETDKMKEHIKIVPDEEEVAIDVIPLATKPPSIVD
ncbi:hypothetical protein Tco_1306850, partial [Tanacetum coccineum]